jgi:hypothetical protein
LALKVVGAGLGRTGTNSLKLALEHLLGRPCYHMWEVHSNPRHAPVWTAAMRGKAPDWDEFLGEYGATIDFPAAAFWPELMEAYPDALVLLSFRDTDAWWKSCERTIFSTDLPSPPAAIGEMIDQMWASRFTTNIADEAAAKKAYESFNNNVRRHVPSDRLLEWQPGDGWESICAALGMKIPEEPFPHVNSSADFLRERGPDSATAADFKDE